MEKFYKYLSMDGYSFYIWTAYGIWFFLLLLLIVKVIYRKKIIENKIKNIKKNKYYDKKKN